MAIIAQLVRVPDCGSEGRGFESHWSPKKSKPFKQANYASILLVLFFGLLLYCITQVKIVIIHPLVSA
jgi:hypothetical protein